MSIATRHPQYTEFKPLWDEAGAALGGQQKIKEGKEVYLPATSGMRQKWDDGGSKAYDAYKMRARFSDIPSESMEGMLGILFGKDPLGSLDEIVTNDGKTVWQLGREIAEEVYSKGRHVLVIEKGVEVSSTPYIAQYVAESFINWKIDKDANLTLAVFEEQVPESDDKYSHKTVVQYREYTKSEVNVYDKDENLIETFPLDTDKIQIVVITPTGVTTNCSRPPITRVVECALAAYRNSADYQQAMFLTAQPTATSAGCTEAQFKANSGFGIGAGAHWWLGENADAKSSYMEFSGKGIEALKNAQDAELEQAAEHAVKLSQVSGGVESGKAKQIRDTAQKSALSMMADSISIGMNVALSMLKSRTVQTRNFEPYQIQIQNSQEAEATMVAAIGNRVNAGGYPNIVEYNYALQSGLFSGTYEEWEDAIDTGTADGG